MTQDTVALATALPVSHICMCAFAVIFFEHPIIDMLDCRLACVPPLTSPSLCPAGVLLPWAFWKHKNTRY